MAGPARNSQVVVRLVNQTKYNVQFQLVVDGTAQTLSCSVSQGVAEATFGTCPSTIQFTQELWFNTADNSVAGGRV